MVIFNVRLNLRSPEVIKSEILSISISLKNWRLTGEAKELQRRGKAHSIGLLSTFLLVYVLRVDLRSTVQSPEKKDFKKVVFTKMFIGNNCSLKETYNIYFAASIVFLSSRRVE